MTRPPFTLTLIVLGRAEPVDLPLTFDYARTVIQNHARMFTAEALASEEPSLVRDLLAHVYGEALRPEPPGRARASPKAEPLFYMTDADGGTWAVPAGSIAALRVWHPDAGAARAIGFALNRADDVSG
jgi:hypothetical protein